MSNKTENGAQVQTPEKEARTDASIRPAKRSLRTGIKAGQNMCW